ncbi:arrestin domain-containing protein 3-like isoform X3 [Tachypleus tridentatus]|uniref:arrestin domain-containing protein 3-like isoform X3 n=1 Tax=Tachypleus tridentatus TaxID=6853 RepID=UPI003FD2C064
MLRLEYFFMKQVLFGGDSEEGREKLAEGHHEFPFSFQLPSGGVSTSFEGKYGSIRYWLKSEMEKPWSFNHKTKKAFTLISPIDINRMEYLESHHHCKHHTFQSCTCNWDYGESIAITADFENLSSRTIVPHATLHQTQTFVAGGKSRFRRSKFTIVTGLAIQPSRMANWDSQLLKIPAVSPSIVNSCLIRVDYAVRITLQIPGVYNLSVDLPVVIGTVPLRTQPPNYRTLQSNMENLPRSNETRLTFYPPAPPYNEVDMSSLPDESPPMYAECVEGSVDITEDDDNIIGDTRFTPMYACVHDYPYQPPPAYSEIDPHPAPVVEEGQR